MAQTILVVEDNAVNRRLVEFLLRSHGYKVLQAATAQEAFKILRAERPDLILMDIQLPGTDGLEATRRLKADPTTRNIPVVAVTSYAMSGDRDKALAAGCVGYLSKPLDKAAFVEQVALHARRGNRDVSTG